MNWRKQHRRQVAEMKRVQRNMRYNSEIDERNKQDRRKQEIENLHQQGRNANYGDIWDD